MPRQRIPAPRRPADDAPPSAWSVPAYLRLAKLVGLGVREAIEGLADAVTALPAPTADDLPDLRGAGARLLAPEPATADRTEDRRADDVAHPAYASILAQLAPDEARVLAHLLDRGVVAAIDIVTGGPVGRVLPTELARCLTELDVHVELWQPSLLPQYLNNLFRLGLVWHSPEPVERADDYRALESRACVRAVLRRTRMSRVVRRSLHLTPLGEEFTRTCFADGAG